MIHPNLQETLFTTPKAEAIEYSPPWFVTHETKTRQSLLPSLVAAHSAQPRLGLRPADKVATKFYPLSFLLVALPQWQI